MSLRRLIGLVLFSIVIFFVAYPLVDDMTGSPLKEGRHLPQLNAWIRSHARFTMKDPDKGEITVTYVEYMTRKHAYGRKTYIPDRSSVLPERNLISIARKYWNTSNREELLERCKADLNSSKRGVYLAKGLDHFNIAPDPLPVSAAASGAFFLLGTALTLILRSRTQNT